MVVIGIDEEEDEEDDEDEEVECAPAIPTVRPVACAGGTDSFTGPLLTCSLPTGGCPLLKWL